MKDDDNPASDDNPPSVLWQKLVHYYCLLQWLGSVPIIAVLIFVVTVEEKDRQWWGVFNSYVFSIPFCILYLHPYFFYLTGQMSWRHALKTANENWVCWLSCGTQIVFQIPHQLFPHFLHLCRERFHDPEYSNLWGFPDWPFYAYGQADARWGDYHLYGENATGPLHTSWRNAVDGSRCVQGEADCEAYGHAPIVSLINWNDATFGVLVLIAYIAQRRLPSLRNQIVFWLLMIFRDATLWRETTEYFWMEHRLGYPSACQTGASPHTFEGCLDVDAECVVRAPNGGVPDGYDENWCHPHGVANLWTINVIWLIAPLLSPVWVFHKVMDEVAGKRKPNL